MKKKLSLLVLVFMVLQSSVMATAISLQTAQTIALNFLKVTVPGTGSNVTDNLVYTQTESDGIVDFYVFNLAPAKGFVIVSANDNALPVLAYSTESYFNSNNSKFGLGDWLSSISAKLHYAVLNNIPGNANITYQWTAYLNGQNPVTSRAAGIGPLCTTTWNQEPYYNALCPFDTADNQRAVTGCVATAMAQIMKYWNYPARGTGSYSYDDVTSNGYSNNYGVQSANFGATAYNWQAMPTNVTNDTSAVDTLMYQCGVSVAMDYGDDNQNGSGAIVLQSEAGGPANPCAQYSYANYFSYNPNTLQGVKLASYSTSAWISLMENEINSGRVIQYEGDDPTAGGHTWVCDGYQTNGMLHMNWGWGGSADGYFAVGDLSAGGYTFSEDDGALIGIEPLLPITLSVTSTSPAICSGGNTTLTVNGPVGATYTWSPSTGLSCTSCAAPVANPVTTTLYQVTADSAGIQASTSMAVVIISPVTAAFTQIALPGCTLPENVTFSNTSTNATNYLWDFGDGTTDSTATPVHPYLSQGTYTVKLYTSNACGADSLIKSQAVDIIGGPPVTSDKNICPGQSVELIASGVNTIGWFVGPTTGASELTTGTNYTPPTLNTTTTYYVGVDITPAVVAVGPTADAIGAGSYYTRTSQRGLDFNCTEPQTLISVDVYSDTLGVRNIVLKDSSGNTLDSTAVSVAKGHETLTLNWQLPVGNQLGLFVTGLNYLYRNNSGVTFPYTTTDGTISITGPSPASTFGASYYFFYNWKVQKPACQSARTPVTVFVLGTGGNSIVATGTGTPAVNFAPADTAATTFAWSFGDGATSTAINPQHTYTANGSYTVQLIVSNGSCSDTTTRVISTVQLGISQPGIFSDFNLFPNPAKDQITLNVNAGQAANNCRLSVRNLLGETVYTNTVDIAEGANNLHLDISSLAASVYIITLQNGNDMLNARFVKGNE